MKNYFWRGSENGSSPINDNDGDAIIAMLVDSKCILVNFHFYPFSAPPPQTIATHSAKLAQLPSYYYGEQLYNRDEMKF